MPRWRSIPWAATVVLLGGASGARAEGPVPRVRLEYRAAADCPSEPDFVANVKEKTAFDVVGSPAPAPRTFSVTLRRSSDGQPASYRGELFLRMSSGAASTREVTGVNCAEIAEAIAVIIAIELGPEQQKRPTPSGSAGAEKERAIPTPAPREPVRARWAIAAAVGASSGLSDVVSPEARLWVALRRDPAAWSLPEFRAGVAYSDGRIVKSDAGSLEIRLIGVTLEGCFARARASRKLWLEPCAQILWAQRTAIGGPPSSPDAYVSTGQPTAPYSRTRPGCSAVSCESSTTFPTRLGSSSLHKDSRRSFVTAFTRSRRTRPRSRFPRRGLGLHSALGIHFE
jgi:hypothetical protein